MQPIAQALIRSAIAIRCVIPLPRTCWNGYDIRTVQALPGHTDVLTTMIYTHVLNKPGVSVVSPFDTL